MKGKISGSNNHHLLSLYIGMLQHFLKNQNIKKINCRLVLEFVTVFEKKIFFSKIFRNYEIFQKRKMHLKKYFTFNHCNI